MQILKLQKCFFGVNSCIEWQATTITSNFKKQWKQNCQQDSRTIIYCTGNIWIMVVPMSSSVNRRQLPNCAVYYFQGCVWEMKKPVCLNKNMHYRKSLGLQTLFDFHGLHREKCLQPLHGTREDFITFQHGCLCIFGHLSCQIFQNKCANLVFLG